MYWIALFYLAQTQTLFTQPTPTSTPNFCSLAFGYTPSVIYIGY